MKVLCLLLVLTILFIQGEALKNLMGTDIHKCISCLCHARTGCWRRRNCASYSISFDYWKTAGSPVLDPSHDPDSEESYKKCLLDENCIVNTIDKYTSSFGELDCNCDGKFDCKDRFAIHLNGERCVNPNFGRTYARRFNECAQSIGVKEMLSQEGYKGCVLPDVQ
ncbi:uncharacterized protein LOC123682942 [Harmonia axyridis]|uniref:lysozyme n=1 Tax=Harmonia axyridis TaxID=115357 RepID=A0A0S1TQT5_HARAX|nr:uncharacterized protein LOC123682942 [Harmonia axyridis]ALM25918.1 i-type lysozyme 3 [Harmonia axyridis]